MTEYANDAAASSLANDLCLRGFDICHTFRPSWYNGLLSREGVAPSLLRPLPAAPSSRAFLVGNTRALWPPFLGWIRGESHRRRVAGGGGDNNCGGGSEDKKSDDSVRGFLDAMKHPLDTYAREQIEAAVWANVGRFGPGPRGARGRRLVGKGSERGGAGYEIFWSDSRHPRRMVSMQWVAEASGLCYFDRSTMLAVHPTYGAWISFGAVVVFDSGDRSGDAALCAEDADPPPPPPVPCLVSEEEAKAARAAMGEALAVSDGWDGLCRQLHGDDGTMREDAYRPWIKMRDCIGVGRDEFRFSNDQLMYHYTKDKRYLLPYSKR